MQILKFEFILPPPGTESSAAPSLEMQVRQHHETQDSVVYFNFVALQFRIQFRRISS